jgi:hypothetical protein
MRIEERRRDVLETQPCGDEEDKDKRNMTRHPPRV